MRNDSSKRRAAKNNRRSGRLAEEKTQKHRAKSTASRGEKDGIRGMDRAGRQRQTVPPKRYRIGEIVDYVGVSRQTIHNYTTMGLLHEVGWTRGGHRLYGEEVFARLEQIAELRAKHRSLEYIQRVFMRLDARERGQEME